MTISTTTDALYEGFARPLAERCTIERVRAMEAGQRDPGMWRELDQLGYCDALVPEKAGGAGLAVADVFALLYAAGQAGVPWPFGDTIMARALLAHAGVAVDNECIALAKSIGPTKGRVQCADTPGAALADAFLVAHGRHWLLLPAAHATVAPGVYRRYTSGAPAWSSDGHAIARLPIELADPDALIATVHAAEMAGAMESVLRRSIDYAQARQQFGRPLSKFQAIQQEISIMAEQTASVAMAGRIGCSWPVFSPSPMLAAVAKLRACEAVPAVCAIAHAVHGAIGITEELPLGVFTRRLLEWRSTGPGERQCAALLGRDLLTGAPRSLLTFVREALAPTLPHPQPLFSSPPG